MIGWSNTGSFLQLTTTSPAATTLLCWQSTANFLQLEISTASEWGHTMSHSFLRMVKKSRKFTFILFISFYLLLFIIIYYFYLLQQNCKCQPRQEKAHCVVCVTDARSDLHKLHNFPAKYLRTQPITTLMHEWHKKFTKTGRVLQQTGYGTASTTAEDVEQIRQSFVRSPQKSANSQHHDQQCTKCYTCASESMHTRFKLCRLSGPMIIHYIMHLPQTFWNDGMKTMNSLSLSY
jgi:hypothetical protein